MLNTNSHGCLQPLLHFMCFVFCVLSLWVSVHDHNDHDEEANVGYEDQYHWSNDGPDEP